MYKAEMHFKRLIQILLFLFLNFLKVQEKKYFEKDKIIEKTLKVRDVNVAKVFLDLPF